MGTSWSLRGYACEALDHAELHRRILDRFEVWNGLFSTWIVGSFISEFHSAPNGTRVSPPERFAKVVRCAIEVADASGGAFNPCLGGPIAASGFGSPLLKPGAAASWSDVRKYIAADELVQPGGLQLDLSAIAKGAAVDEIANLAGEAGVVSLLAEIGGVFIGRGVKPDGMPWWVDVEPVAAGAVHWRIAACDLAVATSGDGYASRRSAGELVSHVARLSEPNGERSCGARGASCVTVVHRDCARADERDVAGGCADRRSGAVAAGVSCGGAAGGRCGHGEGWGGGVGGAHRDADV